MAEKTTNSLPVEVFRPDEDDFEEWILRFETAVVLATNVTDKARKSQLCRNWLSLKLDDRSRIILGNCKKTDWDELKVELRDLLIDPQEKYNWRARRSTIVWDGKESFHVLAANVKRAVDRYDPKGNKEQEYFFRFRDALPLEYRRAIDLGVSEDKLTIEEAKKMALRVQTASSDSGGSTAPAQPEKSVSFVGASMASMSDDRLKSIELSLQGLTIKVDNMDAEIKQIRKDGKREDGPRGASSRERYEARYPDRSASRGRGFDRDSRQGSFDRGRDSRDRRDDRSRWDRRDSGDRRDDRDRRSWDRRDSRDRRDSQDRFNNNNRGQRDNQGWRDDRGRSGSGPRNGGNFRDRRDSRDRFQRDGRDRQNGQNRGNNRQDDGRTPGRFGSVDQSEAFDWFCAAVAEKASRDGNTEN